MTNKEIHSAGSQWVPTVTNRGGEVKGKDPDAQRSWRWSDLIKGAGRVENKVQAKVIHGKARQGQIQNRSQREHRQGSVPRNPQIHRTKTHKGCIIQGGGSQKKTKKTNRLKRAEIQITGFTDKTQEDQATETQETRKQCYRIAGIHKLENPYKNKEFAKSNWKVQT